MRQLRIFLLSIVATLLVCNSAHALKSDWFNPDWSFSGKKKSVCYNATDPASPAVLAYSPSSLAFGNATTSSTHTLTTTLSNTGGSTATGLAQSGLSAPFSIASTTCGSTLEASGSCTTTVQYAPTDTVASSGTLTASATGITAATAGVSGTVSGQIVTVSSTTVTGDLGNIYDTLTKGQSFKAPITGHLTAFRFKSGTSLGTAPVAVVRCGTSADLTMALEYTVAITAANTVYGVILTTPIAVTSGQTVYCGVKNSKTTYTDRMSIQYANPGTYADGAEYQASSWNLSGISAYDLYFAGDFQ